MKQFLLFVAFGGCLGYVVFWRSASPNSPERAAGDAAGASAASPHLDAHTTSDDSATAARAANPTLTTALPAGPVRAEPDRVASTFAEDCAALAMGRDLSVQESYQRPYLERVVRWFGRTDTTAALAVADIHQVPAGPLDAARLDALWETLVRGATTLVWSNDRIPQTTPFERELHEFAATLLPDLVRLIRERHVRVSESSHMDRWRREKYVGVGEAYAGEGRQLVLKVAYASCYLVLTVDVGALSGNLQATFDNIVAKRAKR